MVRDRDGYRAGGACPRETWPAVEEVAAGDRAVLGEVFHLRVEAWADAAPGVRGRYPRGWRDEDDAGALHWVCRAAEGVVAAARLRVYPRVEDVPAFGEHPDVHPGLAGPFAALGRAVVRRRWRRRGLATALLRARLGRAAGLGCRTAVAFCWALSGPGWLAALREGAGFRLLAPEHSWQVAPFGAATPLALDLAVLPGPGPSSPREEGGARCISS